MDDTIGISLSVASSYLAKKENILLITSNLYKAQQIYNYLLTFIDKNQLYLFPTEEIVRAEVLAESKELLSTRLYTLSHLFNNIPKIVIANSASIARYLPNPQLFLENSLHLEIGNTYSILDIKKTLINAGYTYVSHIDQSLQFALRGDILDIYSINLPNPVRIEFFDDQIESIRYFDISTQQSIEKISNVDILPASDLIFADDEINNACDKIRNILETDQKDLPQDIFDRLRDKIDKDICSILEHSTSQKLYKYYSLISNNHYSLLDYCIDYKVVLVNDSAIKNSSQILLKESFEYLRELFENGNTISHLEMYQDIYKCLANYKNKEIIKTSLLASSNDDVIFNIRNIPYQTSKQGDIFNIIELYLNQGYIVNVCLYTNEHLHLLSEILKENKLAFEITHEFASSNKTKLGLSLTNLPKGFVLPEDKVVYLTSNELFNEKVKVTRFDARFKEGTVIKTVDDLKPGDYVVHEYQGIGQFLELQTLEVEGNHRDYLKIAYFGNELLYVPLSQFQLVRKYLGKEGLSPRLSHLHSKDWENTKKRIKERIDDLASRLFNLYSERNKIKGFSFQKDDEFQKAFEDKCDFELTKDQYRSLQEIKKDMESDKPMDRLLCGDVGFGKTEVAFRAAFKAILSGKQVVMLCPTTLLARQHFETALSRFSGFDVKIALFSRLVPLATQKNYIKEVASGNIHLIIGTHRVLNKEIMFNNLGLVIVDEEQRFGVEQKERLKELKTNVDVLTLSATPIPRTLQISLLGVRSMSVINTPPKGRMPIQTYLTPYKIEVVKELIERELGRGGQVYYLHNNIDSLYMCGARLQKALPGVNIGVAHGQMAKSDLENVMEKFYNGKIDVLVCTTIIENGIDIPNANMLIVEDSEHYGLSQLYQIKGRVGRSDRIAYAYLMYNEDKIMNEKAQKRLDAILDFTELGSGYKIAQRDLLIRGAGDILGPEQAGFIDSIGLDLYIKLLNEAVQEKISGVKIDKEEIKPNLILKIDAYIPKEYANDSDKIELYQEILTASTSESLFKLKDKTLDIFGNMPESVDLLFIKRNIDILISEVCPKSIKEFQDRLELYLSEPYINIKGIGNLLFESLIPYISRIKVSYINHQFKIVIQKTDSMLSDLEGILYALKQITNTNDVKVIK